MISKTVLLDTSFLITLLSVDRPHHLAAKQYYRYFLENSYSLFLSTIAVSEYCLKGSVDDLPLRRLRILPFNLNHAVHSGKLNFTKHRLEADARNVIKDDFKLLAQCAVESMALLITDDGNTLFRYAKRLAKERALDLRCVKLQDGFDVALVNESGQREFPTPQT